MNAPILEFDGPTRGKEKIRRIDYLDDYRGVSIHYDLANRIVLSGFPIWIHREILEKIEHSFDIRWVDSILRLLHAQHAPNVRVLKQNTQC